MSYVANQSPASALIARIDQVDEIQSNKRIVGITLLIVAILALVAFALSAYFVTNSLLAFRVTLGIGAGLTLIAIGLLGNLAFVVRDQKKREQKLDELDYYEILNPDPTDGRELISKMQPNQIRKLLQDQGKDKNFANNTTLLSLFAIDYPQHVISNLMFLSKNQVKALLRVEGQMISQEVGKILNRFVEEVKLPEIPLSSYDHRILPAFSKDELQEFMAAQEAAKGDIGEHLKTINARTKRSMVEKYEEIMSCFGELDPLISARKAEDRGDRNELKRKQLILLCHPESRKAINLFKNLFLIAKSSESPEMRKKIIMIMNDINGFVQWEAAPLKLPGNFPHLNFNYERDEQDTRTSLLIQ